MLQICHNNLGRLRVDFSYFFGIGLTLILTSRNVRARRPATIGFSNLKFDSSSIPLGNGGLLGHSIIDKDATVGRAQDADRPTMN
jgi:hypothetical protein